MVIILMKKKANIKTEEIFCIQKPTQQKWLDKSEDEEE